MNWKSIIGFAVASMAPLLAASSCYAQTAEATPLWQDVAVGDNPEAVAQKLAGIDGIKSAKVKRSKKFPADFHLMIDYYGGANGIAISGYEFAIFPEFEGESLNRIKLISDDVCANYITDGYNRLFELLHRKYPSIINGYEKHTSYEMQKSMLEGTLENPSRLSNVFSNGATVSVLNLDFSSITYLPFPYYQSPVARLGFELRQQECGGSGTHRVKITIEYLTDKDFRETAARINDAVRRAASKDQGKL